MFSSEKKQQQQMLVLAAAIVLAAIIVAVAMMQGPGGLAPTVPVNNGAVGTVPTTMMGTSGVSQAMSYTAAIKKYGSNRFQFDADCAVIPTTATYKSGTRVMLDNRDESAREVTIGAARYTLPGYGWLIISLPTVKSIKTYQISCDDRTNVATVLMQP